MSLEIKFTNVRGSRHDVHDLSPVSQQTYSVTLEVQDGDTYESLLSRYSEKSTKQLQQRWRIIRAGQSKPWNTPLSTDGHDWINLVPPIGHWSTMDPSHNPLVVFEKAKWKQIR